jgi:hypothetical protein
LAAYKDVSSYSCSNVPEKLMLLNWNALSAWE